MYLLQNLYIFFLAPIHKIVGKIDEKARDFILSYAIHCLIFNMFMYTAWANLDINFGYAHLLIINAIFLGVIIVFSIKEPLRNKKKNRINVGISTF